MFVSALTMRIGILPAQVKPVQWNNSVVGTSNAAMSKTVKRVQMTEKCARNATPNIFVLGLMERALPVQLNARIPLVVLIVPATLMMIVKGHFSVMTQPTNVLVVILICVLSVRMLLNARYVRIVVFASESRRIVPLAPLGVLRSPVMVLRVRVMILRTVQGIYFVLRETINVLIAMLLCVTSAKALVNVTHVIKTQFLLTGVIRLLIPVSLSVRLMVLLSRIAAVIKVLIARYQTCATKKNAVLLVISIIVCCVEVKLCVKNASLIMVVLQVWKATIVTTVFSSVLTWSLVHAFPKKENFVLSS